MSWNDYPGQQGYQPPPAPPSGFGFPTPQMGEQAFNYGSPYAPSYGAPAGGYPPPYGHPHHHHQHHHDQGGYAPPPGPPPVPPRPDLNSNQYMPPPGPYSYNMPRSGHSHGDYQPPPMPPSRAQQYGPSFEGADFQQHQLQFQYSNCSGKKKALCIGINYIGQRQELRGCINDANNVSRFIQEMWGYNEDDIVMLTDESPNPRKQPTKNNIYEAMKWLVRDAQPNDSLFFHYSGHGGQTKDQDGDEADGFDEVIYPVDFQQVGHIVDDEMHQIMVKSLPQGCRLTAIFDSCHSGSAIDLPYVYSTEGKVKEPNLAAEAGQGLLSAVTSYARGDMGGVLSSVSGLLKAATGGGQRAGEKTRQTRTSPADVISWSGCKDSQTSADTQEAGQATGAMSYAFIESLRRNPRQSYQQLLVSIRAILRDKYSQKPQLSSSHPIDVNYLFVC